MVASLKATAKKNECTLIDALMRSGADLFYELPNGNNRTIYDDIMANDPPDTVTRAMDTLFPQLIRGICEPNKVHHFIDLCKVYSPPLHDIPDNQSVIKRII